MIVIILFVLMMGAQVVTSAPAEAASCTPGTDCYCDRVKNVSNPIYDANLLMCEDFEAPTLRNNTGVGNGAPYYGPPYDIVNGQSSGSCNQNFLQNVRGCNGYWPRLYPGAVASHWSSGQPTAPTVGVSCSQPTCPGMIMWHATDRWDGNGYSPKMAIYGSSTDFTAEGIAGVGVPTNTSGNGASGGLFDGSGIMVHRIPAGQVGGILGDASWPTTTEVGFTIASAYSGNATAAGIWGPTDGSANASWKHNEWRTVTSTNCGFDGIFLMYNQQNRNSRPFAGFIGGFGACSGTGTDGVVASYCSQLSVAVGTASCTGFQASNGRYAGVNWQADTTLYQQTRDWPEGTWGCTRGHMIGLGTTTARYRIWFTPTAGPNSGTELLIFDMTYNDDAGSGFDNRQGYIGLKWNNYANTNQGGGYSPSTATVLRYEDNVHVRNGVPVSCSQIGFSGTAPDTTPPAAPTGLTISKVQ